jgi:hypothetical protein
VASRKYVTTYGTKLKVGLSRDFSLTMTLKLAVSTQWKKLDRFV